MAQNTIKVMEYVLTNDSVVKHKNVECRELGNKINNKSVYKIGSF